MSRWLRLCLLALAAALVADQAVRLLALSDGEWGGRRVAPYDPPLFNAMQEFKATVLRERAGQDAWSATNVRHDAQLGWAPRPASSHELYAYDALGARIGHAPTAAFKPPGRRRVVAVGGSFTHGDEVGATETWLARLEALDPTLETVNLGVGAYGLDQALLRLRRDGLSLQADEVWLGLLPSVVLRVVTMYRPALRHDGSSLGIKPRFVLRDGELRLVPNPARDVGDVVRLIDDQPAFLDAFGEHDHWVARARAAYAPAGSHWMHWSALGRLVLTKRERADRDPAPWLSDPGSEVSRLARALVLQMRAEVEAQGSRFRLIVLPDQKCLRWFEEPGGAYWSGLLDGMSDAGVEVVDTSEALRRAGAGGEPRFWMPGGHYAPETSRLVAEAIAAALAD